MSLSYKKHTFMKLEDITLDTSIPQSQLNIEAKNRSNLFPWKGQFSPQLIDLILDKYSRPNFSILDPFLGSGTVIIESASKNLKVIGTEINPAAFFISKMRNPTHKHSGISEVPVPGIYPTPCQSNVSIQGLGARSSFECP